jgi:Flp pilus assembly protein TadB
VAVCLHCLFAYARSGVRPSLRQSLIQGTLLIILAIPDPKLSLTKDQRLKLQALLDEDIRNRAMSLFAWFVVAVLNLVILFLWFPTYATSPLWKLTAPLTALILIPTYLFQYNRQKRRDEALPALLAAITKPVLDASAEA